MACNELIDSVLALEDVPCSVSSPGMGTCQLISSTIATMRLRVSHGDEWLAELSTETKLKSVCLNN
jgi:hypothetical protein